MELRPCTDWSTKPTVESVQENRSWLNTERNLLNPCLRTAQRRAQGAECHGDGPIWLTVNSSCSQWVWN